MNLFQNLTSHILMLEVLLESAKKAHRTKPMFLHTIEGKKAGFLRQIRKDLKYFAKKQNTYFV